MEEAFADREDRERTDWDFLPSFSERRRSSVIDSKSGSTEEESRTEAEHDIIEPTEAPEEAVPVESMSSSAPKTRFSDAVLLSSSALSSRRDACRWSDAICSGDFVHAATSSSSHPPRVAASIACIFGSWRALSRSLVTVTSGSLKISSALSRVLAACVDPPHPAPTSEPQ